VLGSQGGSLGNVGITKLEAIQMKLHLSAPVVSDQSFKRKAEFTNKAGQIAGRIAGLLFPFEVRV
jgi:hypothetical protein